MPADSLIPSPDRFVSHESIAIATLSLVVFLLVGAIVAMYRREKEKEMTYQAHISALSEHYQSQINLLIENFRSDMKEAWAHGSKITESVREVTSEIKLQSATAAARYQSDRPRSG